MTRRGRPGFTRGLAVTGRQLSPRPSDASPTARRLPRTVPLVTGRSRSPPYPAAARQHHGQGRQLRAKCAGSRKDVTASGPERRALSGPVPPASTVLRIPLRGTRLRRAVDPGASTGPAGLTATARPKAGPQLRAANLRAAGHDGSTSQGALMVFERLRPSGLSPE